MKLFYKKNKGVIFAIMNSWAFIVLFTILAPLAALAAEKPLPIEEVVAHLQKTYEKTKDFKASFLQETFVQSIKKTDIEEGTVFLKNPKNMLWSYSKPKAKKLIVNNSKAWLYLPREKVVYTQEADAIFKSKTLIKFLSGLGKLKNDFSIKYAEPQMLDTQGNYQLVLTPLENNPSLNPFSITVDKNIYLIVRVNFEDTMGNSTTLKFSNISVNTGLTDKMFQFHPPEGISIFKMP